MKVCNEMKICKEVVRALGKDETLVQVMEECSELQKECSKMFRNKGNRQALVEEMGDVIICLDYLRELYNISNIEILEVVNRKNARSLTRLKNGTLSNRYR